MIDPQSPDWHHTLRNLVQFGNVATAGEQVEAAYTADPTLRDGFASIASVYRESKNWAQAQAWLSRDYKLGRLSGDWQLRYAEVVLEPAFDSARRVPSTSRAKNNG